MKLARVAVLGVAVGAGLVAALLAMNLSSQPPAPEPQIVADSPAAPVTPMEQVLVATKDIPVGSRIAAESVEWKDWPSSGISERFIANPQGEDAGPKVEPLIGAIARATIYQGEPITEAKLIKSDRGFMSAILPTGMRAVAVRIAADTSAGGFILPNDRVDVIMTRRAPETVAGGAEFLTETILNNVRVLAIDQTIENVPAEGSTDTGGQTVVGQTATLELTPEQAQIITVAQQMSDRLALALRSIADASRTPNDATHDALHLIGGTRSNNAVTVVKNGVPRDVTGIR